MTEHRSVCVYPRGGEPGCSKHNNFHILLKKQTEK